MGALSSLFRRGQRMPSISVWPPAPSGVCDICNSSVPDAGSARVPGREFKDLVERGYNPVESGRIGPAARALYGGVGTDQEFYVGWKALVLQDTTDWGLCGACAADLRAFIGEPPDSDRTAFLEETFGDELAATLTEHLGPSGAADFAETTVAEARARWSHRNDDDFLTDEERQKMADAGEESGTNTLASRAGFQVQWMAEKVAGEVTRDAMDSANLPDDNELYLNIGARVMLALD